MNNFNTQICRRCQGTGTYQYFNTATYNTQQGTKSTPGPNRDTCDVCWGTGDTDNTGPNLRKGKT